MKKLFLSCLTLLVLALLTACASYHTPVTKDSTSTQEPTTTSTSPEQPEEDFFSVSVVYNGQKYLMGEDVLAQWTDGYSYYTAPFDENGVAKVYGPDGDFQVTLSSIPEGYTYDPNAYIATNDCKEIVIELYKLATTRGRGNDLYTGIIELTETNVYRAELTSENHIIYYQFVPRTSGIYTIESWVDTTKMEINPKIDVYNGSMAYKVFAYTLDDGGPSSGFTKNFRYEVRIDESQIGSVFAFGIKASVRGDKYPATVDFAVKLNGSFSLSSTKSSMMIPEQLYAHMVEELAALQALSYEELMALPAFRAYAPSLNGDEEGLQALFQMQYTTFMTMDFKRDPEKDAEEETKRLNALFASFWNVYSQKLPEEDVSIFREYLCDLYEESGTFVGAETEQNGYLVFDGDGYKLNETTGFYHVYNPLVYTLTSEDASAKAYAERFGEGYGPILYANITSACRFLDLPFTAIEYMGNKALTVSSGTENYKHFLEGWNSMVSGASGVPGAYCSTDCTGCHKNEDGSLLGSCTSNVHACLEGCLTCTSACNPCREELLFAPGYGDLVNDDGNFPVTQELKDFLQKYSVSQLLFFDGNGYVETGTPHVDALEDDQWLFACGYYQ